MTGRPQWAPGAGLGDVSVWQGVTHLAHQGEVRTPRDSWETACKPYFLLQQCSWHCVKDSHGVPVHQQFPGQLPKPLCPQFPGDPVTLPDSESRLLPASFRKEADLSPLRGSSSCLPRDPHWYRAMLQKSLSPFSFMGDLWEHHTLFIHLDWGAWAQASPGLTPSLLAAGPGFSCGCILGAGQHSG